MEKLKNILEAVLLSADKPMKVPQLEALFEADEDRPTRDEIRKAIHELGEDYAERGFELKQVASGFRLQVKQDFAPWVGRLWEDRPARYTRALLETLALITYRQPITRGEIEEVRGVSVSSNIIRTLLERDWIKVLGHKDVPGKPTLYGTTREFLDYFNLKSLDELPSLADIKDLDQIYPELALEDAANTDESESDSTDEGGDTSESNSLDSGSEANEEQATDDQDNVEAVDAEAEIEVDESETPSAAGA
jgi:segregation and condensation protein B